MAMIFSDNFEHYVRSGLYTKADMLNNGWFTRGTTISEVTASTVDGVEGSALKLYGATVTRPFTPANSTSSVFVGMKYRVSAMCNDVVCSFAYSPFTTTGLNQPLCNVTVNRAGGITLVLPGPTASDKVYVVSPIVEKFWGDSWHWIEIEYVGHKTAGKCNVWIDGFLVLEHAGGTINPRRVQPVNAISFPHELSEFDGLNYAYYDTIVIYDDTGTTWNARTGPLKQVTYQMTQEIDITEWPSVGGVSPSDQLLPINTPDINDSSYLYTNIPEALATFMGPASLGYAFDTVNGVQIVARAARTALGVLTYHLFMGPDDDPGDLFEPIELATISEAFTPGATLKYNRFFMPLCHDLTPWTSAKVIDTRFGLLAGVA